MKIGFLLALLVALGCATAPAKPAEDPQAAERQTLAEAKAAMVRQDFAGARKLLAAAIADHRFASYPSADRHRLLFEAAFAAKEDGQTTDALRYIKSACVLPETTADDLFLRLDVASRERDLRDVVVTVTLMARRGPDVVGAINDPYITSVLNDGLGLPHEDPVRFEFLNALFDAGFKTKTGREPDWLWKELAILLLERGQSAKAEAVVSHVSEASALIAMRADNRFDAIVAASPARFDVAAMLSRRVDDAKARVRAAPRSLKALMELCEALSSRGLYRAALDAADEALTRVDGSRVAPYDDMPLILPWVRNERSDSLWALGRWDESIEELQRASRLQESGHPNVGHMINLAGRYVNVSKAKEALETLRLVSLENANAFGLMQVERVRAVASDTLGDGPATEKSLAYLREHHTDAEGAFQSALVRVGRLDEAARLLETRLADPGLRSDALTSLQEFKDLPSPPSPAKWAKNWEVLMEREDVKAAIAKVGKIEHYEFPAP
jgi:tetratricopeptide (TPR) repeat protein